jgi:hypothetical protein
MAEMQTLRDMVAVQMGCFGELVLREVVGILRFCSAREMFICSLVKVKQLGILRIKISE